MEAVIAFADDGGLVLGDLQRLPGAVRGAAAARARCSATSNRRFTFRQVELEVVEADTAFTQRVAQPPTATLPTLSIPAKHSWGRYYADEPTLAELEAADQVVLRYAPGHNFNGSLHDIAGVRNAAGNVFGMMPHPEHAVDPLTGSTDGLRIFESMRAAVEGAHV